MAKARKKQSGSSGGSDGGTLTDVTCESAVSVADLVYKDSDGIYKRAVASAKSTARVMGVCISKSGSTTATILLPGHETPSIFSGLDITKDYFLSAGTPGGIVQSGSIPASGSGGVVLSVGRPTSTSKLAFNLGSPFVRSS